MADERLYQFPSKPSPVPADIIFAGDSANSFDEVNITIAQLISAYPNLSSIGGLTLGANTYPYVNNSSVFTAGSITAFGVSVLALASAPTVPAALTLAAWDTNKNLSANNFLPAYATTATAAATTTLTAASAYAQFFTGSTTQTVLLPVTSTLFLGFPFYIVNNSSGNVTVQSSGANNVQVMAPGTSLYLTCVLTSGTTAASWNAEYAFNGGEGSGTVNLGTANQIAYYATSSTIVSGTNLIPNAVALQGVVDGSNATAGNVGEFVTSQVVSPGTSISNGTPTNLTSISLTAGDWDVWGNVTFIGSGTNLQALQSGINTTSATLPDESIENILIPVGTTTIGVMALLAPMQRISISGTTTVYIVGQANFASGTCTQCGFISARRVR